MGQRIVWLMVAALLATGCAATRLEVARPEGFAPPPAGEPFAHEAFDAVLVRVVEPRSGRVNYAAVREAHIEALDAYLASAADAQPDRWPANDQKAFWINVHNAAAMRLVAEHWPLTNLRRIRAGLTGGPLDVKFHVAGRYRSLADMQRLIVERFADPTMVYALNWGCEGCPPLGYRAYQPIGIEKRLRDNAMAWLESDAAVEVHRAGVSVDEPRTVRLAGFFQFFPDALTVVHADREEAARRLRPRELPAHAPAVIEIARFDWTVNASDR